MQLKAKGKLKAIKKYDYDSEDMNLQMKSVKK